MGNGSDKPSFDVSVPSPARVWNFWVGGKDNYESDRAAAAQILAHVPTVHISARLTRNFLSGAVEYMIREHGVTQFLDIGSGLPTADNTHEVAQRAEPSARIVYVDNDPVVILHARALLNSAPQGRTDYIQADLREVDEILAGAARTLDFTRPVGVILLQVLHFMPDSADPYGIIGRIMDTLPSGSFLVVATAPADMDPGGRRVTEEIAERSGITMRVRTLEEVARFFDRLEVLGPGVVSGLEWLELWSAADGVDRIGVIPDGVGIGHNGIGRKP